MTGLYGATNAPRSVLVTSAAAVSPSLSNAAADRPAAIAFSIVVSSGRRSPVMRPRWSSAVPPAASVATVVMMLAPGASVMFALQLPRPSSRAAIPFTSTRVISAPLSGDGATVPRTSTVASPGVIVPRSGESTCSCGGSGRSGVSVCVQAAKANVVAKPRMVSWRIPGLPRRCARCQEQPTFQPREIPHVKAIHRRWLRFAV
jgi:hypothetical protein